MRILQLVHQYLPEHVGGTELHTRWLAEELARRGHGVSVFYRRSANETMLQQRLDPPGVQVWAVGAGPMTPQRRFLATFGDRDISEAFRRAIAETSPDLVHVQHLMGLPAALMQQLQGERIPFLVTLHDYWWVCANAQLLTNYSQEICAGPRAYLNCARCALARAGQARVWPLLPGLAGLLARRNQLLRRILRRARALIAPSQFVADWYIAHGAPAEKLRVIPHGSPRLGSQPRLRRPGRALRFAYIGGLAPSKGVHLLVEAFGGLADGAELWLAGDERADSGYVAQLRRTASPGVQFLGALSRQQVWETLAQADVVVVPSLWYETFSYIISEAFAAGVPVIASHLGALAERVRHEVDGLLVPPGDVEGLRRAMWRLSQEPGLLTRLEAGVGPGPTIEAYTSAVETIYAMMI